ncbi:MAG TPA: YtxH domain-containing protein [Elusimicrobiota bacterium]|nr:YtxH domain-containing protein [Elusimicrobiota bacterium]
MESNYRSVDVIGATAAFFVGAAAGAVAGMLLAPASGRESREALRDWLKDKREESREAVISRKERVEAAIAAGREAYERKRSEG